jgi:Trypsin-co-occurring domain 1
LVNPQGVFLLGRGEGVISKRNHSEKSSGKIRTHQKEAENERSQNSYFWGPVHGARPGEIAANATQSFEVALAKVCPAAEGIIANLRTISVPPAEIEVEFSIKLSAGAGAFIASAGDEGHYRVHLKWQRE